MEWNEYVETGMKLIREGCHKKWDEGGYCDCCPLLGLCSVLQNEGYVKPARWYIPHVREDGTIAQIFYDGDGNKE